MLQDKHIVIILSFNSPMGGLHLNVIDTLKFLIEKGIEVSIISKKGIFSDRIQKIGASFIEIDFNNDIDININTIISSLQNPTLIHTHPFHAKDIAVKLSNYYNIPLIMTLHSINDKAIKSYEEYIDIFIAVSDLVRDFIISQGVEAKKIFVIPNGIYKNELLPLVKNRIFTIDKNYKNILTVSRYAKDKKFITDSIYYTLEKMLDQKIFNFNWIFVGDGEEINKIKNIAKKINLASNREMICFLGWQEKEKIISLYQDVDIFVGPGRSAIEAMLFENIIIAIGSKGYVGIINEDNYLDGIYSNFGGDKQKNEIMLLYKETIKVLSFDQSTSQKYQKISKIIIENFFNLDILNKKLLNIYDMLHLLDSISLRKKKTLTRLNYFFNFNNDNFKSKHKINIDINKVVLKQNSESDIVYIVSSNKISTALPSEEYNIENLKKIYLNLFIYYQNLSIRIFVIEFDHKEKIFSKSYELNNGYVSIKHIFNIKTKRVRIAFRINDIKNDYLLTIKDLEMSLNPKIRYIESIPHIEYLKNNFLLQRGEYTYEAVSFKNKYLYYANYKPKQKIIIAFNGAIDRNKRIYEFQRFSWSQENEYSWIIFPDPTIKKDNELSIGWYQGSKNEYAIQYIAKIITKIIIENNIQEKDITFFGSSAGGFAALQMANLFSKSKIIVVNPQIYLYNYYKKFFFKVLKLVYDTEDYTKIEKNRIEVHIDFAKREVPILYIQNKKDKLHYENHLLPFLETIDEKDYNFLEDEILDQKLQVLIFEDEDLGHTPISKKDTFLILNKFIEGKE